jgi:hypothetical protein
MPPTMIVSLSAALAAGAPIAIARTSAESAERITGRVTGFLHF